MGAEDTSEFEGRLFDQLRAKGVAVGERELSLLQSHCALVREWNGLCSLVSTGDVVVVWERHVLDSLRLALCVAGLGRGTGSLLDVGSGGGFPGIVLKVVFPGLFVTLVERSEKKVGFLRRVVGTLGLDGIDIVCGEFPRASVGVEASILTARAVENPKKIAKGIVSWLRGDRVFVCQTNEVAGLFSGSFHVERVDKRFHVEHVNEDWLPPHHQRGSLHLIKAAE